MKSDRGDSFPFDFEPNGFPFGSKSIVMFNNNCMLFIHRNDEIVAN